VSFSASDAKIKLFNTVGFAHKFKTSWISTKTTYFYWSLQDRQDVAKNVSKKIS
jgi:hypothetical protein